jgi:hypothetical protein
MSRLKAILTLVFLSGSLFCSAQGEGKLVESQVDRMISDWNTRDFRNMDLYTTEDVEWINLVGAS